MLFRSQSFSLGGSGRVKVKGKMLKEPSFKELPEAYGKKSQSLKRGLAGARTKSEVNNTKQVDV